MKNILFVDDETKILDGLKRMLRTQKDEWCMNFISSGPEALTWLDSNPCDVIVSDMRMPRMDGATLLKNVQKKFPHVVRIVLSGQTDMEAVLRAVPIAHQFLTKPCNAEQLKLVIQRACDLQNLLNNTTLRETLGKITQLPSVPRIYHALTQALEQTDTPLQEVSNIIEQDLALTAKILQLVNSAFFGLPRQVTQVQTAVSYLGINMLKNLALSVEIFESFQNPIPETEFSIEELHRHSLLAAKISKTFFKDKQTSEDAFIAAMLHDVGQLIMAKYFPDSMKKVFELSKQKSFLIAEREVFGITHAEMGAYLLGIWGLPYPVVEAVAHHHDPENVPQTEFDILSATYISNILASDPELRVQKLDEKYMQRLGLTQNIFEWQKTARELSGQADIL